MSTAPISPRNQPHKPAPSVPAFPLGTWLGFKVGTIWNDPNKYRAEHQAEYKTHAEYIDKWIDDTYKAQGFSDQAIKQIKDSQEIKDLKENFQYISERRVTEITRNIRDIDSALEGRGINQSEFIKQRVFESILNTNSHILSGQRLLNFEVKGKEATIAETVQKVHTETIVENSNAVKELLKSHGIDHENDNGMTDRLKQQFPTVFGGTKGLQSINDGTLKADIKNAIETEIRNYNSSKIDEIATAYQIPIQTYDAEGKEAIVNDILVALGLSSLDSRPIWNDEIKTIQNWFEEKLKETNNSALDKLFSSYGISKDDPRRQDVLNQIDSNQEIRSGKRPINNNDKEQIANAVKNTIDTLITTINTVNTDFKLTTLDAYLADKMISGTEKEKRAQFINTAASLLSAKLETLQTIIPGITISEEWGELLEQINAEAKKEPSLETISNLHNLELMLKGALTNALKDKYESTTGKLKSNLKEYGLESIEYKSFSTILDETSSIKDVESKLKAIEAKINEEVKKLNEAIESAKEAQKATIDTTKAGYESAMADLAGKLKEYNIPNPGFKSFGEIREETDSIADFDEKLKAMDQKVNEEIKAASDKTDELLINTKEYQSKGLRQMRSEYNALLKKGKELGIEGTPFKILLRKAVDAKPKKANEQFKMLRELIEIEKKKINNNINLKQGKKP